MSKNSIRLVTFSTNIEQLSPISQITKYIHQSKLKNYKQPKQYQIDFTYQPKDCPNINIEFMEIKKIDQVYSVCSHSDTYILIIDLEGKGAFQKMEDILEYMSEACNMERKLFVIGLYTNMANVPDDLKEDCITSYLDSKELNYDYVDIAIDSSNEILQVFDYIMKETLENKRSKKTSDLPHSTIEINIDKSKSTCLIV